MHAHDAALVEGIDKLLKDPRVDPGVVIEDEEQAARAVRLIEERLQQEAGVYRLALERSQEGAETLSSDRLQVLSEMVQNSDDAGATEIRFTWRPDELLVAHNGHGVRLGDILLLGLPWLSGKSLDPDATGRFGIGLTTLRALSTVWEVHCHPFHVEFSDLSMRPVTVPVVPAGAACPQWTVFRIPFAPGTLTLEDLSAWFEDWDDSALVFLRQLKKITLLRADSGGPEARNSTVVSVLGLTWQDISTKTESIGDVPTRVRIRHALTTDGSAWRVYETRVPAPPDVTRLHKAAAETVPVAVALPLTPTGTGSVHAGLPVAPLDAAARVHAQFDPVASREGFASRPWNDAMVPFVADLWALGLLDVLSSVDPSAWHLVPLPSTSTGAAPVKLPESIRSALLAKARSWVSVRLTVPLPGAGRGPLAHLAVEDRKLTEVVTGADIARLAGLPHAFPESACDAAGRWRQVLSDWRSAGYARLREEVQVTEALRLLKDPGYEVERTLRLTSVCIEAGLSSQLIGTPCIVTADGRRLVPPTTGLAFAEPAAGSPEAAESAGPLAAQLATLGVVLDLDDAYWQDTTWARTVTSWLRSAKCLVVRDDASAVLGRVAQLGANGGRLGTDVVTDVSQLAALRSALGEVTEKQRKKLGKDIGKTVVLQAFRYDRSGREEQCTAGPGECALPLVLDSAERGRFAFAARKTPGITWVHRSYGRSLVQISPGNVLSRTAFLRLLGVADAPRLTRVPQSQTVQRYSTDRRRGLPKAALLSTEDRDRDLASAGASHTLDDLYSPQLDAVLADLIAEPDIPERRKRTAALVHTLGKHGLLPSREHNSVIASHAHHAWNFKRATKALWVWRLCQAAWLEDTEGVLQRPGELYLRTHDALALYGQDDPGYLHPEIQRSVSSKTDVLHALGVSANPDVPDLFKRLRQLRGRCTRPGPVADGLAAEVQLVYLALAGRLGVQSSEGARGAAESSIRSGFRNSDALVLTDEGWQRPANAFRGITILRGHRPFVLPEPRLTPLWEVLGVREPRAEDLADVLKEIAKEGTRPTGDRQRVMLDALRRLTILVGAAMEEGPLPIGLQSKLRSVPLWTSSGWTKDRPVHAVDNPVLTDAVAARLPVWRPGGDLQQFGVLLDVLRIDTVETAGAHVLDASAAQPDESLTAQFSRAVDALQDTLVRDEPEAARAFTGWPWLSALEVRVLPGLRIRVEVGPGREPVELSVNAQLDRNAGVLFVAAPDELGTTRGGGQALASAFARERAHVGHRWRDIWENGAVGVTSDAPLTSASQRDHEDQERLKSHFSERMEAATRPSAAALPGPRRPPGAVPARAAAPAGLPSPPAGTPNPQRRLVDAAAMLRSAPAVTRPNITQATPSAPARPGSARRPDALPQPRHGGTALRPQSGGVGCSDRDKEDLTLQMLVQVLEAEGLTLQDNRGHLGLGADAVDSSGRFYELKSHGGPEPTELSFTGAELNRAHAEGADFSLVIGSYLEHGTGRPTLRIITDPLRYLSVEPTEHVRLKGIRSGHVQATVYTWPEPGSQ